MPRQGGKRNRGLWQGMCNLPATAMRTLQNFSHADLVTARLDLVCATPAMLECELDTSRSLAKALGARVPATWPTDLLDAAAVEVMLDLARSSPAEARWGAYYITLREPPDRTLVGIGGFKGPPCDGCVEIGYSVLPEFRRQRIASEAVGGWVEMAFADPRVDIVIAHTFPSLVGSIGVLERAGFRLEPGASDPDDPGSVRYVLPRP